MQIKIGLGIVISFLSLFLCTCRPSQTDLDSTATQMAEDLHATATQMAEDLHATQTAAPTVTPTPAPVYEIGSSRIRESDGMVMVYVPEGEFLMGSEDGDSDEQPVHMVYLNSYWIDKFEVTVELYEKCVDAGPCTPGSGQYLNPFFPANVNWEKANSYCRWAGGRLPSEAEWEKAARGIDGRIYPWGNFFDQSMLNSGRGESFVITSLEDMGSWIDPVGSYPGSASPYGALDMSGNYREWVADWYDENYYSISPTDNPGGPDSGDFHVLRGGFYSDDEFSVRSANRDISTKTYPPSGSTGFRCVVDP